MKIFAIVLIFAIQGIYGDEDRLIEAIKNSLGTIEKEQDALKTNILNLEEVVDSATEIANTKLTNEVNSISESFKEPTQTKELAAFKTAYTKLIEEARNSAKKILEAYPDLIDKYLVPSEYAELSFTKIENEIKALKTEATGSACKENILKVLIDSGLDTVGETRDCVLVGASNFPTIPTGIRYIRDEISKFTNKSIGSLKRCQHEEGSECIKNVTDKVTANAEEIQNYAENYLGFKQFALNIQKDSIKKCVTRNMHTFESYVTESRNKISKC